MPGVQDLIRKFERKGDKQDKRNGSRGNRAGAVMSRGVDGISEVSSKKERPIQKLKRNFFDVLAKRKETVDKHTHEARGEKRNGVELQPGCSNNSRQEYVERKETVDKHTHEARDKESHRANVQAGGRNNSRQAYTETISETSVLKEKHENERGRQTDRNQLGAEYIPRLPLERSRQFTHGGQAIETFQRSSSMTCLANRAGTSTTRQPMSRNAAVNSKVHLGTRAIPPQDIPEHDVCGANNSRHIYHKNLTDEGVFEEFDDTLDLYGAPPPEIEMKSKQKIDLVPNHKKEFVRQRLLEWRQKRIHQSQSNLRNRTNIDDFRGSRYSLHETSTMDVNRMERALRFCYGSINDLNKGSMSNRASFALDDNQSDYDSGASDLSRLSNVKVKNTPEYRRQRCFRFVNDLSDSYQN